MCDDAPTRVAASASATLELLPPETIVVHVAPYLSNADKGALAKSCGRFFRLLRSERLYYLSPLYTAQYYEDEAFRESVKAHFPEGRLVLRPFECALRSFHEPPFNFRRAENLFYEACYDAHTSEREKARAYLYKYVHYLWQLARPDVRSQRQIYKESAEKHGIRDRVCVEDEGDPVRAFEMGMCHMNGIGVPLDYEKSLALFVSSANAGCAAGMVAHGMQELQFYGPNTDRSIVVAQFERAAAMGHVGAMFELGKCLLNGIGAKRNGERGGELIRKAAENGASMGAVIWLQLNGYLLREGWFSAGSSFGGSWDAEEESREGRSDDGDGVSRWT